MIENPETTKVEALTDSVNPRDYWFKMKIRVKGEDGIELSTFCRQLKMDALKRKIRVCTICTTPYVENING